MRSVAATEVGGPLVELLWWEGCPSTEKALALLREEMAAQGLDPDTVVMREVATGEDVERERFVGSPTIRIGGVEVAPAEGEAAGLTCRVYRQRDGRVSPTPAREDLREALAGTTGASDPGGADGLGAT